MSRVMIIPAAGFGRRVGTPEAKELLVRSALSRGEAGMNAEEPLIELPLRLAAQSSARAVVVTREEKVTLLSYLEGRARVVLVKATREWPESILHTREEWGEFNLVCLPDTDFAPLNIVDEIFSRLETGADVVFATFVPGENATSALAPDLSKWGVVCTSTLRHCEKPQGICDSSVRAWGLFGFRRESGEALLHQMLESTFDHQWRELARLGSVEFLLLKNFSDLTRSLART